MTKVRYLNTVGKGFLDQEASIDVRIRLDYQSLEAHRLTKTSENSQVRCLSSVYLGEILNLSPKGALLPFLFNIETKPEFFSFKVKGNVLLEGSPQSIKYWSFSEGDKPPKIWHHVYQDILKVVSGLAQCLNVSLPV